MERKQFIKTCGFACLGASSLAVILESCASSAYYAKSIESSNCITILKTEFIQTVNNKQKERAYILLKYDKFNFPICVSKLNDQSYCAVLLECTHKSCELKPQGNFLICPCHGSKFTNAGIVQNPPAEENLKSFQTKTDHDKIYIFS